MERRRLQEAEHVIIHRWTCQLHEVMHERIAIAPIGMQEATGQIKPSGGGRLPRLPFEDGIGAVGDRVGRTQRAGAATVWERRAAVYRIEALRSKPFRLVHQCSNNQDSSFCSVPLSSVAFHHIAAIIAASS